MSRIPEDSVLVRVKKKNTKKHERRRFEIPIMKKDAVSVTHVIARFMTTESGVALTQVIVRVISSKQQRK